MPTPTFQLSGSALEGITVSGPHKMAVGQLPQTVKLGRKEPRVLPQAVKMASVWDAGKMKVAPPNSINRRDKAALSISRMYKNDQLGCCVISGKAHLLGVVSANDVDSDGIILASDAEIEQQYHQICGPGDNGCYISEVLNVFKSTGFKAGGKMYKIDGYVAVDHKDVTKTKVVQVLFGASTIGFSLPQAWMQTAVWDVTNSPIIGGHDVTPIDYDERGVYVSSWGRIYLITWAAWTSNKYITEFYAILSQSWYNNDKLAPSGFDVAKLKEALATLGGGGIPEPTPPVVPPPVDPPPTPVDPPPGPVDPATYKYWLTMGAIPVSGAWTAGGTYPVRIQKRIKSPNGQDILVDVDLPEKK